MQISGVLDHQKQILAKYHPTNTLFRNQKLSQLNLRKLSSVNRAVQFRVLEWQPVFCTCRIYVLLWYAYVGVKLRIMRY